MVLAVQKVDFVRIRRIALAMRGIVLVSAVLLAAVDVAIWMVPEWVAATIVPRIGIPQGARIDLDGTVRMAGFALSCLPLGLLGFAMFRAAALFAEYANGRLFSRGAADCLHAVARAILGLAILSPLMQTAYVLLFTLSNGPGERLLYLGLSSSDLLTAIVGGLLFAVALVMREAAKVAEENAEFV